MKKWTVTQIHTVKDIWKDVEAKDAQEAIDICMGGRKIDETKPMQDTETYTYLHDGNDWSEHEGT
ncbi:hypothetical protein OAP76_00925 [Alphaproteobacteria bacterium]|nr:hypothetical protein [Alphaproteobacteria bacterium]